MAKNKVRVRYAPSPTGHLHIGNARTALFNYLFARHNKGTFVLRIEDTDTKRNVADGEKSQMENLKWLGIDWDEGPDKPGKYGPYRQSERKDIYQPLIQELLDKGLAYESYMKNKRHVAKLPGMFMNMKECRMTKSRQVKKLHGQRASSRLFGFTFRTTRHMNGMTS